MKMFFDVLGGLLVIYALILYIFNPSNLADHFILFTGLIILILHHLPHNKLTFFVKGAVATGYVFLFIVLLFILTGVRENVTYNESVLVVLGCQVRGDRPSAYLWERIKKAENYAKRNPSCIIIASGGQGKDEIKSEARAIKDELVKMGIEPERILLEERSATTEENFRFSKEIADKTLNEGYTLAYVTNDFHCYRAGLIARKCGTEATSLPAHSPYIGVVPNFTREVMALVHFWIFGK